MVRFAVEGFHYGKSEVGRPSHWIQQLDSGVRMALGGREATGVESRQGTWEH